MTLSAAAIALRSSPDHRARCSALAGTVLLAFLTGACTGSTPAKESASKGVEQTQPAPGIDPAGMDRNVKPGDDFFAFSNGTWIRNTEIPADQAAWGSGQVTDKLTNQRLKDLLEGSAQSSSVADVVKAGKYYAAYMNEAAIEQHGLAAIKPRLDEINAVADRRGLATMLGRTLRTDVDPLNATNFHTEHLFGLFVAQDFNDPTHNIGYLLQGGLGMPDREYYVGTAKSMVAIREKYAAHIARVLELANLSHGKADVDAVLGIEQAIAKAHGTREDSMNVQKANNLWTRDDFSKRAPGLDWNAFFTAANLADQTRFIVWHPGAVTGEAALVSSQPVEAWKAYLRFHAVNEWMSMMPKAFVDQRFEFYSKTLYGNEKLLPRWQRGVILTGDALGDAVGQLYVGKYFPPEAKAKVGDMVDDIKKAFVTRIDHLDWMSPETKAKAKAKVDSLIVGVGYPDKWRDYSTLEVTSDDALANVVKADEHAYSEQLAKLRGAVDRHEWWMTAQTVNAVNLPIQNALNFPAAILQEPLFSLKADAATNYGAIGSVIGHEISHSFDDQGSQFDATGRLTNWWQPADFAHFKEAATKLVNQYSAYKPFPDLAINGQLTLSENIADVAGLSAAYDAYRIAEPNAPTVDGFTADQRFFISYAQAWRDKLREPLLRSLVVTDGHAPSEYRADTVRNLDAWYAAFNVQSGEKLYLSPEDRVRVW